MHTYVMQLHWTEEAMRRAQGEPRVESYDYREWKQHRRAQAKANQWGTHLRATFGTRLGEAGYNAFEIADLMGHSDIHTTRRYVRVMEGKKREAVKATMFQQARVIEMPGAMRKEA